MALIPLYEAKTYLRVDSSDEDALIGILLSSAEQMCKDVGRLSEDQWEAVNAADRDAENGVQPTRELEALRSTCRVAILYALGYLFEHRDEADHKQLMLTLRSILFAVREGGFCRKPSEHMGGIFHLLCLRCDLSVAGRRRRGHSRTEERGVYGSLVQRDERSDFHWFPYPLPGAALQYRIR